MTPMLPANGWPWFCQSFHGHCSPPFFVVNAAFWTIKSNSTSAPHSSTVSYIFLVECHMNSTISNGAATNWEAPWTHRGFFAGLILRLLRGNHRMDAFIQSFSLACPGGGIGGFMNGQATKSRKAIWRGVYSRWVSKWRVSLSIFRTRPYKTGTH